MKIKKPEMIFFDCGGTLISDVKANNHKGVKALFSLIASNPYGVTENDFEQCFFQTMREARKISGKLVEISNSALLKYTLDYFSIQLYVSIEQAELYVLNELCHSCQIKNADKMLQTLYELNIRSGIITNVSWSHENVKTILEALFPMHSFEMIITSSEYIFRKPDKHIFEIALKKAQLKSQDVWYVGNEYEADIIGAVNAGLTPVMFAAEDNLPAFGAVNMTDCLTVSDWSEFVRFLKQL